MNGILEQSMDYEWYPISYEGGGWDTGMCHDEKKSHGCIIIGGVVRFGWDGKRTESTI